MNKKLGFLLLLISLCYSTDSRCTESCDLVFASYYIWEVINFIFIGDIFKYKFFLAPATIITYNTYQNFFHNDLSLFIDDLSSFVRINVPFPCNSINSEFPGDVYYNLLCGDTYNVIADKYYSNLTTIPSFPWFERFNSYPENNIPDPSTINVTVNCSCGDCSISKNYGLYITYPLRPEDTLESFERQFNITAELLQRYNDYTNFSANFNRGRGLVYITGGQMSHGLQNEANSLHSIPFPLNRTICS